MGKHQVFGHLHENFGHTKSWNWIVFQFMVKCIQCLISNKILFFFFKFWNSFFVLKFCHVWWPQKMKLIFKKYFLGKLSLLTHHIMKKEKRREKKILPLFLPPPNPVQKIIPWKKQLLTPPNTKYNQIPLFFKFTKTPHLKKTPWETKFLKYFNPYAFLIQFFLKN